MSEEQLINEIKKNPILFGRIYDEHYGTIFNYCYRRTRDFSASKDITSETFLKAYINIHRFKWRGAPLLSWLYRIASNEINLHHRAKKYRPTLLKEIDISESAVLNDRRLTKEKEAAESELGKHEQFLLVQRLLQKIPLKYQEVISLKYFEKLKIREISTVLNKPEGTVKSLLSRGIALIRNQI
ncbi:MAG TPA: RNA polymerase sigma factor [Eudoraea sp.]|nr:RNA polymerase sigma factor [Eudoraea sp.]